MVTSGQNLALAINGFAGREYKNVQIQGRLLSFERKINGCALFKEIIFALLVLIGNVFCKISKKKALSKAFKGWKIEKFLCPLYLTPQKIKSLIAPHFPSITQGIIQKADFKPHLSIKKETFTHEFAYDLYEKALFFLAEGKFQDAKLYLKKSGLENIKPLLSYLKNKKSHFGLRNYFQGLSLLSKDKIQARKHFFRSYKEGITQAQSYLILLNESAEKQKKIYLRKKNSSLANFLFASLQKDSLERLKYLQKGLKATSIEIEDMSFEKVLSFWRCCLFQSQSPNHLLPSIEDFAKKGHKQAIRLLIHFFSEERQQGKYLEFTEKAMHYAQLGIRLGLNLQDMLESLNVSLTPYHCYQKACVYLGKEEIEKAKPLLEYAYKQSGAHFIKNQLDLITKYPACVTIFSRIDINPSAIEFIHPFIEEGFIQGNLLFGYYYKASKKKLAKKFYKKCPSIESDLFLGNYYLKKDANKSKASYKKILLTPEFQNSLEDPFPILEEAYNRLQKLSSKEEISLHEILYRRQITHLIQSLKTSKKLFK